MRINTFTIGQRLALGFGIVIFLMLVLTAVGIHRVMRIDDGLTTINQINSVKQRYAINFRGSVHDRAIALRDVVLADEPETVSDAEAMIDRLAADYAGSAVPLDAMLADSLQPDADEQRILAEIKQIEADTMPLIQQVRELRAAEDREGARLLVLEQAAPAFTRWLGAINQFIDLQEAKNQAEAGAAAATARGFAALMLVLCVLAMAIGAAVALLMTRSVTGPLHQALRVAERVGKGDLGSRIVSMGSDETAQLLAAMARMQDQLVAFSGGQREIAERHEAGEISFRMDSGAYPGVYGTMADDINELVAAHIAVKMRMVALVERYAIGDFSEDMPALPGEKARISETMATTKINLTAISREVKRLSSSAAAGDFSARGDVDRFEFDYRAMVHDLNGLMATADANLTEISGVFDAFARGDLTVRMAGDYPGVFGRIRDDAHETGERLTEIVRGIQGAVASINSALAEIAAGNGDLSSRTEQQAASLEETSALMEEMIGKVRRNAEHARRANQLARGAGDVAAAGGQMVTDVVATMGEISASSRRIADIIGVIDGIAFQTNILALNAAVEAARAGDQGRGFAVVASEVRSLAQRSAGAAKDIKQLIEGSVEKVELGAERVERAGTTMTEIVNSVKQVTDIMGEITEASNEQSTDIEQVSRTISELDEVTQQNAALVEEASASARGLQDQAAGLADAVAVFQLEAAVATPLRAAA